MAIEGYDLNDMMTALGRAHAAGNVNDAQQIAGLVAQHYPQEAQTALAATPPAPRPPSLSQFAPSLQFSPTYTQSTSPQIPMPPLPAINPGPQPGLSGLGAATPVAQGGANASATPAPVNPPGGNWLSDISQTMGDMAKGWSAGVPFGQQAAAGLAAGISSVAPGLVSAMGGQPKTYAQALQTIQGQQADAAARSPIASTVGQIGGAVSGGMAGGALLGRGLQAAGAAGVPYLSAGAAKAANIVEALGRRPVIGGVAAGAGGAALADTPGLVSGNKSLSDMAIDTVIGGGMGAVVGGAANIAVTKLAPAAESGWRILTNKLNGMANSNNPNAQKAAAQFMLDRLKVDPTELASHQAQMMQANGGQPVPLAAVLNSYSQAQLAKAAAQTPELGNELSNAAQAFRADAQSGVPTLIDQAASAVPHPASPTGASGVQQNQTLAAARNATMDNAMAPLRGVMAPVDTGDVRLLNNAYSAVRNRLGGVPANDATEDMLDRVRQAVSDVSNPSVGTSALSLNDLEQLRRTISQAAPSAEENALAYNNAQTLSRNVAQIGADAEPAYADALSNYATHSRYIEGHAAGLNGTPLEQVKNAPLPGSDNYEAYVQGHGSGVLTGLANKAEASPAGAQSALQTLGGNKALQRSLGQSYSPVVADQLATTGEQLSQAHAAFRNIAPRSPVGESESSSGIQQLAHGGIAEAAGAGHLALFHWARAAAQMLAGTGKVSPTVAPRIVDMLVNRNSAPQALNVLRQAGIDNATISRLVGSAAAAGGAQATTWNVGR